MPRLDRLFAINACYSYQHSDPEYLNKVINKELGKVNKWLLAKFLLFNKTSKNFGLGVEINGFFIEQIDNTKHLK